MSCVSTSLSKSKFVITSSFSPVLASWLYAPYKPAVYIIFTALNLILNYPGLKLAIAIYGGLSTGRPLPCVPYVPYIPVRSGNITQRHF